MTRILRGAGLALCSLLPLCGSLALSGRADTWNKKTIVTFAEDVEIPGQILPAGTYVFKLANFTADRHIVQIWNADEDQILATIMTIPAMRLEPAGDSDFEFEERPRNSPMALNTGSIPVIPSGKNSLTTTHTAHMANKAADSVRNPRTRDQLREAATGPS